MITDIVKISRFGKGFYLLSLALVIILGGISSCHKSDTEPPIFQLLSSNQTNIHFVNRLSDSDDPGILKYLYFYNGGGVAIGDINNDGLPDIFFTSNKKGGNKLYLNKGNYQFEDITAKAGNCGNSRLVYRRNHGRCK
jgi:hypothetical protein